MTLTQLGIVASIVVPSLGGVTWVAKMAGDTQWVPISNYQEEKLYDLKDEADDYADREEFGEQLTPLDKSRLRRIQRHIERLQIELQ